MVVEAGGGSGVPTPPGGTKALVWSSFVLFVDEDAAVIIDGEYVPAKQVAPFTNIDAEQYDGFRDAFILARNAGEIGQQHIAYYQLAYDFDDPAPTGDPAPAGVQATSSRGGTVTINLVTVGRIHAVLPDGQVVIVNAADIRALPPGWMVDYDWLVSDHSAGGLTDSPRPGIQWVDAPLADSQPQSAPAAASAAASPPGGGGTTPTPNTTPNTTPGVNVGTANDPFGGIGPDSTDEEIEKLVREEIGYLAWMLDIPELRDLVFESLRSGATEQGVLAGLMNTDWWRATEPQAREWTRLQAEDPAFANRLIADVAMDLRLEATRLGIRLDDAIYTEMAGEAIMFGWVDLNGNPVGRLLTQALLSEATWTPKDIGPGQLSISMDDLMLVAEDYMIMLPEETAAIWAERIELDQASTEQFEDYIRDLSKSRFPHLAGIIDNGISPRVHFEPYRQQVAALLEVSPNDIDLFGDPRFQQVVETHTDQGVRAMTMAETAKYVRQLPEWESTMNGLTTAARTMEAMLQAFGETR